MDETEEKNFFFKWLNNEFQTEGGAGVSHPTFFFLLPIFYLSEVFFKPNLKVDPLFKKRGGGGNPIEVVHYREY